MQLIKIIIFILTVNSVFADGFYYTYKKSDEKDLIYLLTRKEHVEYFHEEYIGKHVPLHFFKHKEQHSDSIITFNAHIEIQTVPVGSESQTTIEKLSLIVDFEILDCPKFKNLYREKNTWGLTKKHPVGDCIIQMVQNKEHIEFKIYDKDKEYCSSLYLFSTKDKNTLKHLNISKCALGWSIEKREPRLQY